MAYLIGQIWLLIAAALVVGLVLGWLLAEAARASPDVAEADEAPAAPGEDLRADLEAVRAEREEVDAKVRRLSDEKTSLENQLSMLGAQLAEVRFEADTRAEEQAAATETDTDTETDELDSSNASADAEAAPIAAHRAATIAGVRVRALALVLTLLAVACGQGAPSSPVEEVLEGRPTPTQTDPTPESTTAPDASLAPTAEPEPSATPAATPTPYVAPDPAAWELLRPDELAALSHDTEAFTQGLVFEDGRLFESTGLRGESTLRELDPDTGEVLRSVDLDADYFGEGLELVGDRLIQLTFEAEIALVYDVDSFDEIGTFSYDGEGWGLCEDGQQLVMSNGSSELTFRDLDTFEPLGSVTVTFDGSRLDRLNELECVDGEVWANVWQTDTIVRIDPRSGIVTGVVDASGLLAERPDQDGAVLNGIAYDETSDRFLLTGKLWPALFYVDIVDIDRS